MWIICSYWGNWPAFRIKHITFDMQLGIYWGFQQFDSFNILGIPCPGIKKPNDQTLRLTRIQTRFDDKKNIRSGGKEREAETFSLFTTRNC